MNRFSHVHDVFAFVVAVGLGLGLATLALLISGSTLMALSVAPVALLGTAAMANWT